jgi:predicted homoserine dehydrogenase-like protein
MISEDLRKLEAQGRPVSVGVSGAGWMGSGFLAAVSQISGMRVNILADTDLQSALNAFLQTGVHKDDIVEASNAGTAQDAIQKGKRVITGSYALAAQIDSVDIVVDVTPSVFIGAETAYACIQNGKNVVMVNIEADVTVGRILHKMANDSGVLYTVSSGDEPGCLMELWDFVSTLGYEPIVIGKGKNNPLNPSATPDTVIESAKKANKDPYQVASYVDGTKTMFEMTSAANATGCLPMQRGMCGPEADLTTVSQIFALAEDGGIARFPGVVDFVQGSSMSGGVFITVRIHDERIRADLAYLKVGSGKYFTFFRPYHLWFLEAPFSVARAFLYGQKWLVPLDHPVADVMTIAKRDLRPGEALDNFGGYTFHGMNDRADVARNLNALPVGLAPGARLINPVPKGNIIKWDDVRLDDNSTAVRLRRQQDLLA